MTFDAIVRRRMSTLGASLWVAALPAILLCVCGLGCARDERTTGDGAASGTGGAGTGGASTSGTGGAAPIGSGAQPGTSAGSNAAQAGSGAQPAAGTDHDGGAASADAGAAVSDAGAARAPIAIDRPVPDDCITDVSPGDHTFTCQGQTFLVMVDEQCTEFACGLIFDVHGAAMSGAVMRANTRLHELAPPQGFLVVHPSANGGVWDLQVDPPILADFMSRMIAAFHVDERRIHVTGFSMGSAMTFWFLCNHRDVLASTAPVTGSSAEQVTVVGSGDPCIASIDASWQPRVPILSMSGSMDNALTIEAARARTEGIVTRLGLTGGDEIGGDATFTRRHWEGTGGMVFDFIEHDYTNTILAGHCIPGGPAGDLIACTSGGDSLRWGEVALQWFLDHPKP